MLYTHIPNTDLKVSKICLGTMTFGEQNTEAEGHAQLNLALEKGVNFIDVAEMYPVPGKEETYGDTERIIGTWVAKHASNRDKFVLATKVVGPATWNTYIRKGPKYNREQIREALENSLKRLQTDYVDLYQLHWPERKTNFFGQLGYVHDETDPWEDNFLEVLTVLDELVKEGKIRHYGLSNETPWGIMRCLQLAEANGLSRCLTVQNPYSLLNRTFEVGSAEVSMRENVGLLAYSPLAFGMLTGKYQGGALPDRARLTLFPRMARYSSEQCHRATEAYAELAQKHDLSLTQMALAYINSRPFVYSNIIGATNLEQLTENIDSIELKLSQAVLDGIEDIHQQFPFPAP